MTRISSQVFHNAVHDFSMGDRILGEAYAAASAYGSDGAHLIQAFEEELSAAFSSTEAVVVSSDSATVSVLCGASKLVRGERVAATSALPAWAVGALDQAQVKADLLYLDLHPNDLPPTALFHSYSNDIEVVRRLRAAVDTTSGLLIVIVSLKTAKWLAEIAGLAHVVIIPIGEDQPLSTGEGGVLLVQDSELAEAARSYAHFGRLDGVRTGANHKLSPVQAAIGRVQLRQFYRVSDHPIVSRSEFSNGVEPEFRTRISDRFDPSSPDDASMLAVALSDGLSGASNTVLAYESALMEWFKANNAISVSSGYSAVLVALLALELRAGDEVLLTPTCPLCTVYALTALDVKPVFCDTEPDCFSIDLNDARSKITSRTRAILEIPMWGYPVPAKEVAAFAHRNGLPLVLDLALGHGTELDGELIWRHADIATFSTHSSKIFVTGEGGFVLTQDAKLASALRRVRHYGSDQCGNNYRLAAPQAALGRARLPMLEGQIRHRRACMKEIEQRLDNPLLSVLTPTPGGLPCGVKLLIKERDGRGRELNEHMHRWGVPSDVKIYRCRPLYEFPVLADRRADCPNARRLLGSIATLPVHPGIGPDECALMATALNSYQGGQSSGLV